MTQFAFSDAEMGMGRKRGTRRSRFLDRLPESRPWDAWLALAGEARSADAGARGADPAMGRPRVDDLVLPRMDAANARDLDQVPDLVREGGDASGTVPATSASGGGRRSPATPPSPASSGSSPRGARRSARTTWSQRPPSRPPAASSSTSSTGSRICSGCGRRATGGSPRCPTRPSSPSPQPAA